MVLDDYQLLGQCPPDAGAARRRLGLSAGVDSNWDYALHSAAATSRLERTPRANQRISWVGLLIRGDPGLIKGDDEGWSFGSFGAGELVGGNTGFDPE